MFQPVIDKLVGNVDKRDKGLLSIISHRRVYYCIFTVLFQNTSTKGWTQVGLFFFLEYRYYNKNWPFVPPTLLARLKSAKKKKKNWKHKKIDPRHVTLYHRHLDQTSDSQRIIQIYHIASVFLLNFAPSLGNLKYFSGQENRHFIVHWSIAALKLFQENLSLNFGLITVFLEVALQITKKSSALRFIPIHMFSKSRSLLVFLFSRL